MTAHYIAKVVQMQYEKLNIDEMLSELSAIEKYKHGRVSDEWVNRQIDNEQYHRWNHACYLLEQHILYNFCNFEQTDLVYQWAKKLCENKNKLLNLYRQSGCFKSFRDWMIEEGHIRLIRVSGKSIEKFVE